MVRAQHTRICERRVREREESASLDLLFFFEKIARAAFQKCVFLSFFVYTASSRSLLVKREV